MIIKKHWEKACEYLRKLRDQHLALYYREVELDTKVIAVLKPINNRESRVLLRNSFILERTKFRSVKEFLRNFCYIVWLDGIKEI